MQKITPFLWFAKNAEEAMNFYTFVFSSSKILSIQRYPEKVPADFLKGMEGRVLTGIFELEGQRFMAIDGGPQFKFNPSISFQVKCSTQKEVDEFWNKLSDNGEILMPLDKYPFSDRYGWCNDRYGVSWQVIFTGESAPQQKITPALMFVGDVCGKAEEAVNFYTSTFDNAGVDFISRYGNDEEPDQEGTVKQASFTLEGQKFGALESAYKHDFAFNEAISFYVDCENQAEVDYFWEKLSAVPEAEQCGWLKDRYGLSWQIIPKQLGGFLSSPDREKADRTMQAMLRMKKIDIPTLQKVYEE